MPDKVKLVNVTYTVNGQKVSFKAPEGTSFSGAEWKAGAHDGEETFCFKKKSLGNIDLGKLSEEKHRLITAYRYADGKPELSKDDIKILTNLAWSRSNTEKNNKFKNYINVAEKGLAKSSYGDAYFDNVYSSVFNNKTKIVHAVSIELPPDGSIDGIFYKGAK